MSDYLLKGQLFAISDELAKRKEMYTLEKHEAGMLAAFLTQIRYTQKDNSPFLMLHRISIAQAFYQGEATPKEIFEFWRKDKKNNKRHGPGTKALNGMFAKLKGVIFYDLTVDEDGTITLSVIPEVLKNHLEGLGSGTRFVTVSADDVFKLTKMHEWPLYWLAMTHRDDRKTINDGNYYTSKLKEHLNQVLLSYVSNDGTDTGHFDRTRWEDRCLTTPMRHINEKCNQVHFEIYEKISRTGTEKNQGFVKQKGKLADIDKNAYWIYYTVKKINRNSSGLLEYGRQFERMMGVAV